MTLLRDTATVGVLVVTWLVTTITPAAEPVPPFVAGFDRFARHGEVSKVTAGRLLLTELSCTACHATPDESLEPKRGPRLHGAGDRLRPEWVRRYLDSPHEVKPGTTMPEVLVGLPKVERAQAIESLVAFLSTQHEPFPELKAGGANPLPHEYWNKGDVDRGRELYHRVGCVACHAPDAEYDGGVAKPSALDQLLATLDPEEIAELGLTAAARVVKSVPHGDIATKYTRQSLTHFLLDPTATRPSGRMPSLKLEPMEAAHIAAYLLPEPQRDVDPTEFEASEVAEGLRVFEARCRSCHSARDLPVRPSRDVTTMARLNVERGDGCVGTPVPGRPHYSLDTDQLEALIAVVDGSPTQPVGSARVEETLLRSNCHACHERGRRGGVGRTQQRYFEVAGHVDIGDEGRLPPSLDHVGAKLSAAWTAKVLDGSADVRPFMQARMPRFPTSLVGALPRQLAAVDEVDTRSETQVFGKLDGLVEPGRQLLDTGCVQCHPLRDERVPGTVGVDLANVTGRIHPAWFRDFLHDPASLKPRTRMPTFFPKGRSANPDVLDGDVERQIAAMWAYLKVATTAPLPEKIATARSQDFELIPTDRPILLRTFMQEVGTHAIAVGFPAKVHIAFDAEQVRFDRAWRGRFLDAYGTWFVRFAPPADPLGEDLVRLPPGVPLAILKDDDSKWPTGTAEELGYRFSGYRLDRAGVPTFLYRFGPYEVEDRIEPHGEKGLKRRLLVRSRRDADVEGQLRFRALVGEGFVHRDATGTVTGGPTVTVSQEVEHESMVRRTEWLLPVTIGVPLELEYSW